MKDNKEKIGMAADEVHLCNRKFDEIIKEMKSRYTMDASLVRRAYDFALEKHKFQRREDGTPYITHPLAVAMTLAKAGYESDLIAAALLHDVVEDCGVTVKTLEEKFGSQIADIVDAVSAVSVSVENAEMSKRDRDVLSDNKLLNAIIDKGRQKALYIKLADRIHNLQTIGSLPVGRQRAKALHTQNVLIPVARYMRVFQLADELSDLCLKIESPEIYRQIEIGYHNILRKNAYVLEGAEGLKAFFYDLIATKDPIIAKYVVSLNFNERRVEGIFRHISDRLTESESLSDLLTKQNIPLYNINFTISDSCPKSPEAVFFQFYKELHESRFQLTITGISRAMSSGTVFYRLKDCFHNTYRLFLQTEKQRLAFSHGISITGKYADIQEYLNGYYYNRAEPDEPAHVMIPVYKRDGSRLFIEDGATVLDFAFRLNPEIGICARYAHINKLRDEAPLYTRLRPGDMVDVISDHDQAHPENDIPHVSIRWFEYLHTREAIRDLSRYLEFHASQASPKVLAVGEKGRERLEMPAGATVLDFVLATKGEAALEGFAAYLNKSTVPADISRPLRYGDQIRIRLEEKRSLPDISWLAAAKTAEGQKMLLSYMEKNYIHK